MTPRDLTALLRDTEMACAMGALPDVTRLSEAYPDLARLFDAYQAIHTERATLKDDLAAADRRLYVLEMT